MEDLFISDAFADSITKMVFWCAHSEEEKLITCYCHPDCYNQCLLYVDFFYKYFDFTHALKLNIAREQQIPTISYCLEKQSKEVVNYYNNIDSFYLITYLKNNIFNLFNTSNKIAYSFITYSNHSLSFQKMINSCGITDERRKDLFDRIILDDQHKILTKLLSKDGVDLGDSRNFKNLKELSQKFENLIKSKMFIGSASSWYSLSKLLKIPTFNLIQEESGNGSHVSYS